MSLCQSWSGRSGAAPLPASFPRSCDYGRCQWCEAGLESVKRSGVGSSHDIMQIAQSTSGAHTYCYRRGPGGLTPDFLTLSLYDLHCFSQHISPRRPGRRTPYWLLVLPSEPDRLPRSLASPDSTGCCSTPNTRLTTYARSSCSSWRSRIARTLRLCAHRPTAPHSPPPKMTSAQQKARAFGLKEYSTHPAR
jgi:hypothetical protein